MRKNYIFKDVDDTLDNTAIRFVARNGIMDGYADGSFQPDETVTLAELCQIICNCIFDKYDDLEEEYRSTDENLKEKFGNHWEQCVRGLQRVKEAYHNFRRADAARLHPEQDGLGTAGGELWGGSKIRVSG